MIVFDLCCADGHRFEGWFGSSDDFASQQSGGLLTCPQCGSPGVGKAPMAPAVPIKANARNDGKAQKHPMASGALPRQVIKAVKALAQAQAKALADSTWVGDEFAEKSRAMHYGERDEATIHGQATREEAEALLEEGIAVAPLPFPVLPPDELN